MICPQCGSVISGGLTEFQRLQILRLLDEGLLVREVAFKVGVSYSAVLRVLHDDFGILPSQQQGEARNE